MQHSEAKMETRSTLASATRAISSTTLRERLSTLTTTVSTPLKPVVALHTKVE